MSIPKQDKVNARTPSQLKQEYSFGESFAEFMGIAKDAQEKAKKAENSVRNLDEKLNVEEVFNRLTENGTLQGLYRGDDGELYINASFIKSGSLSADLIKTVKFVATAEVFIEPGEPEIETLQQHLSGNVIIPAELQPIYDSNCDGSLTSLDMANFRLAYLGQWSLANWAYAKKSTVTLTLDLTNPSKALTITGTNMWGRNVVSTFGINGVFSENHKANQKINALEQRILLLENKVAGLT